MTTLLESYAQVAGADVIRHLQQLAAPLKGARVVHVNSTRSGGGVAEILDQAGAAQARARARCALGGDRAATASSTTAPRVSTTACRATACELPAALLRAYERPTRRTPRSCAPSWRTPISCSFTTRNRRRCCDTSRSGAASGCGAATSTLSHPHRPVWKYLRDFVNGYDASIFSLADFAQPLPHPVIPDPAEHRSAGREEHGAGGRRDRRRVRGITASIATRPLMLQVSRFDRFKDPVGVIHAYRLASPSFPACSWCWPAAARATTRRARWCWREVRGRRAGRSGRPRAAAAGRCTSHDQRAAARRRFRAAEVAARGLRADRHRGHVEGASR